MAMPIQRQTTGGEGWADFAMGTSGNTCPNFLASRVAHCTTAMEWQRNGNGMAPAANGLITPPTTTRQFIVLSTVQVHLTFTVFKITLGSMQSWCYFFPLSFTRQRRTWDLRKDIQLGQDQVENGTLFPWGSSRLCPWWSWAFSVTAREVLSLDGNRDKWDRVREGLIETLTFIMTEEENISQYWKNHNIQDMSLEEASRLS